MPRAGDPGFGRPSNGPGPSYEPPNGPPADSRSPRVPPAPPIRRTARWPWAVALSLATPLALGLALVPLLLMRPFAPQSARGLAIAYALRRAAPAGTLLVLLAAAALAWRLWPRVRWWGRAALLAALLPPLAAAWMARRNTLEGMFAPLPSPAYARAAEASFLSGGDPVLAVELRGDAVAYPVRQLAYHHIVHDVVGGTPLVATY